MPKNKTKTFMSNMKTNCHINR